MRTHRAETGGPQACGAQACGRARGVDARRAEVPATAAEGRAAADLEAVARCLRLRT